MLYEKRAEKQAIPEPSTSSFEYLYNSACAWTGKKDFAKALLLLQEAEPLCRQTLQEDGYTEEEIEEELVSIQLQKAYSLQMLGRMTEAREIYLALYP